MLFRSKLDATLLSLKLQEDAGIDIVTDGEQSRQHFVHGFLEFVDGIDFAVMGQGGPNRGGNSTADPGDFVNTVGSVIESIDETFDTTFDWEVASFGIV